MLGTSVHEQVLVKVWWLLFVGKELVQQILAVNHNYFASYSCCSAVPCQALLQYTGQVLFSAEYCTFSQQYCAIGERGQC